MVVIQRVLFTTDFSPEATDALSYAREFAEKFGARLYVLHVIEDPTSKLYEMVSGDYHALDRNAREKTQERLARLHREQLQNSPNCETLVERGELYEHILKAVHEKHIDVIVMSAHTHEGFRLHLISNLPEKLVRKAPCHVFVIHYAG
ncbi:MAG: universal stress protein [Deltaproteobacteria bacterium]|nr:universal stress protein [Deltaproteobacteria bacterium]